MEVYRGRVASHEQPMLGGSQPTGRLPPHVPPASGGSGGPRQRAAGGGSPSNGRASGGRGPPGSDRAMPALPRSSSYEPQGAQFRPEPAMAGATRVARAFVAAEAAAFVEQDEDEEWRNPVSYDNPWSSAPMIKVPKRRQMLCCWRESANFRERYRTGRAAYERGHLEEAEAALREAVELSPVCKEAMVVLGQVLIDQEREAEAEECYTDALAVDNRYLLAHFGQGMLYSRTGRVDECIGHFDACLEIDPSHNDARRALTAALNDLGRPRDAIVHFEQAIGKAEDAMSSNPVTLTFHTQKMEKEFMARRAQRSAPGTRLLLLMAFVQQVLLTYTEDVEGGSEQALETGIEEIEAIEREEEALAGQAAGDPASFSPSENLAFADCYLTPLEIQTDPQARAFATALFLSTGDVDINRLPIRSRGIATDGVVNHAGAVDWGTSPACAHGVQPWGLAAWQAVYLPELDGEGGGYGQGIPTATGDDAPVRAYPNGTLPLTPPGTKGSAPPPPVPVRTGESPAFEPLPIGHLDKVEEEEEMLMVWLNRLDHDRTFLWLDVIIMTVTTGNFMWTFHHSFYQVKTVLLSISMILFVSTEILETTFLLVDSDLHYDERDELLAAMSTELVQTIMTTHIHFSLLLVFPQIFGLRWITMMLVCAVVLGLFVPIWVTFGSAWIFFPPHYMVTILFFVLVTAFWVEGFERVAFRTDRLLFIQKECVAQYQADWRKAESLRFRSELDVTEARSALRTRNEMTAFIFHEIRNPLNAMLGAIQMIATTVQTVKERKWAQIAINTMAMVSNVLNDVLELTKYEAGKIVLHKSPFSVAAMLEETAFMFSEQAKQKGISVLCHCANATHQVVIGDEGRLKEALANFCSNAIKFSGSGATVSLMADEVVDHGTMVELNIHVTDTGRGLTVEEKSKLFEPFQTLRDEERQHNQTKGTGLGLVISKHIIAAHNGVVYVESEGQGKGSRFGFVISLEKATGGQELLRSPSWSSTGNTSSTGGDGAASSTRGDGGAHTEDIHVLLVDDDEFNLIVVQDMLESLGWQCTTAVNGTQALEHLGISNDGYGSTPRKADEGCYSCIVTDNIMPVLNGRDLTRRCRQTLAGSCPPIIGLTGSAQLEDLRACKDAGMDTVLTKPVRLGDLAAAVRTAVANAHAKKVAEKDEASHLGSGSGVREAFSAPTEMNALAAAANALGTLDALDGLEDILMDQTGLHAAEGLASMPTIPGLQIEGLGMCGGQPPPGVLSAGGSSGGSTGGNSTPLGLDGQGRPRNRPWTASADTPPRSGLNGVPGRSGQRLTSATENPLSAGQLGRVDSWSLDSPGSGSIHHDL